jgi:hypothetical protein
LRVKEGSLFMAKKTPSEADLERLKKKIREHRAAADSSGSHSTLRTLRKRLRRGQRKQRSSVLRRQHAMGKKAAGGEKSGG